MSNEIKKPRGRPRKQSEFSSDGDYESKLRDHLASKIIGQDQVIDPVVSAVMKHRVTMNAKDRPVSVIMSLGPTGTGKTSTVEALAEFLHGCPKKVLRIDCAELATDHEISRLLGSPAGYIGHKDTKARLSQEFIDEVSSQKSGISILLLDEIEKGSKALHRLLLGIFDKSQVGLGDGTTTNFDDVMIFCTSNIGTQSIKNLYAPVGLVEKTENLGDTNLRAKISSEYEKFFSPEFRNRIDHVIVYNRLTRENLKEIFQLELVALCSHIKERTGNYIEIGYRPSVADAIINQAENIDYGARHIKRLIDKEIVNKLVKMKSIGNLPRRVNLSMDGGEVKLTAEASA